MAALAQKANSRRGKYGDRRQKSERERGKTGITRGKKSRIVYGEDNNIGRFNLRQGYFLHLSFALALDCHKSVSSLSFNNEGRYMYHLKILSERFCIMYILNAPCSDRCTPT